ALIESDISALTIEEVARLESLDQDSLAADDIGDGLKKTAEKTLSNGDLNTNNNSHPNDNNQSEEDAEEEKEGPDWSDWEDADQRIDDEIEDELRQMSENGSDVGQVKVQTSPNPYRKLSSPLLSTAVNWESDVPEAERGLDSDIAHVDLDPSNNSRDSNARVGGASKSLKLSKPLGLPSTVSSKPASSLENTAHKTWTTKGKATGARTTKNSDDFGAGLDIKSVEIKRTEPELDFFADMAPSIQLTSKTPLPEQSKISDASAQKMSINSNLFAVSSDAGEEDGQDTAGWGTDETLDWDAEGF
ncbi:hypothetical protein ElyMa_002687600, partial [Elysia marginata]